ncbi:MAG: leucine-rich repeat domain-containing protein [Eubacterium sp.]|nr:leucine-rich repeat domain-containing protein [Eubacterium sp.]
MKNKWIVVVTTLLLIALLISAKPSGQSVWGNGILEEEATSSEEETTESITGEPSTEVTTSEETTTKEETTLPYEIIDGIYKVQDGVLIDVMLEETDMEETELTIPAKIKKINPSIFAEFCYLETVRFEEGSQLKSIGQYGFKNCSSLKSIVLPDGLESIGYHCFYGCTSLSSITIPKNVTYANAIFGKKTPLKKIKFASGATVIPAKILSGTKTLEKVTLKSGLKTIEKYAFSGCTALKEITIPKGVKTINYKAFEKCSSLTTLTIPKTVTYANTILGNGTGVKTVIFTSGIKAIPDKILYDATTVTKVTVPDGVQYVGTKAFYKCTYLKTIKFTKSVKEIEPYAFFGCKRLKTFTMPKKISKIGKYTFKKCSRLEKLTLPKSLTFIGTGAFSSDKKLTLYVYANTAGKAYARKKKIPWKFTDSEIKRRAKNQEIYQQFTNQISKENQKKFRLKKLSGYVPQGTCVIGKYLVVSMYANGLRYRSALVLYRKSTGKFEKVVYLPSYDHVGSVSEVKGRLVVTLNNISTLDSVGVINYSALKKAKKNKVLKYNYTRYLGCYADFSAYDGSIFWAGHSSTASAPKMVGFKVKLKKKKLYFTRTYSYVIPQNVQGAVIQKKGWKRTITFTKSYGRLNNSEVMQYQINLKKNKSLGKTRLHKLIPSMAEGICADKNNLYLVFESAANLYCGNPDFTSEIQVKNVCKIKKTALMQLSAK